MYLFQKILDFIVHHTLSDNVSMNREQLIYGRIFLNRKRKERGYEDQHTFTGSIVSYARYFTGSWSFKTQK